MKGVVLVLILLFPVMAFAQENDPKLIKNENSRADVAVQLQEVPANGAASVESGATPGTMSQAAPDKPVQNKSGPDQSVKPSDKPKPKIPGSMVGYIDDAIVKSQVRIRFDAGFHDNAPDRAEYFYAQCSCNGTGAPGPNFPGASTNINFQQLYFQAEYAPLSRFSVFTEVPFRWIEPQPHSFLLNSYDPNPPQSEIPSLRTNSGISDVRVGIKLAVVASSNHWLTLQLKAYFPSGDGSRGLGTDHYAVEPSLLYYQRLSQRWAVESQIGDWHPIDGSMGSVVGSHALTGFAGDVFLYGVGPSYQLIDGEHIKFAPVVELFGWHVLGGLQTISPFPSLNCAIGSVMYGGCSHDASGANIINLKVGARTSIGTRNSFYVGFGQALTHDDWYKHMVRLEYRFAF
jgi:Putative MetA-pathway of phenol degradation